LEKLNNGENKNKIGTTIREEKSAALDGRRR